ncbi:hypothetical protein D3C84_818660 [compost metagenome]
MPDPFFIGGIEPVPLAVLQVKAQALGRRELILGDLVQARQVLGDAVLEPETAPEITIGTVDQKQPGLIVDQQVAPLQIVVGKTVLVHGPGVAGQLAADVIDPRAIRELGVVSLGQGRQVFGMRQFTGDHRPAIISHAATLQPPGHHFGGRNPPLGEALEVLPLHFHPRLTQVTAQALACAHIALDVIVDALALNADDFGQRVTGQALALQRKHSLEAAKVFRQIAVLRFQCPTRHQSASPYRCLRS